MGAPRIADGQLAAFAERMGAVPPPVDAPPTEAAPASLDAGWNYVQKQPLVDFASKLGAKPPPPPLTLDEGLSGLAKVNTSAPPTTFQEQQLSPVENATGRFMAGPQTGQQLSPAGDGAAAPVGTTATTGAPLALAMPTAPKFLKAHYDETRDPIKKGTYEAINKAAEAQTNAETSRLNAVATGYDEQQAKLQQLAYERHEQNLRYNDNEQQRQAAMESARTVAQKKAEEVSNLKTDPRRLFRNQDTWTKVMMGIGGVAGGMLSALNGGENQFVGLMNRLVQEDIDKQDKENAEKRYGADQSKSYLGELRQELGDKRAADLAFADGVYGRIGTELQALGAKTNSAEVRGRIDSAYADLQAQRAQLQAARDQRTYVAARFVGAAGGPKVDQERVVRLPDGRAVLARTKEEAVKLRDGSGAISDIQANINKALELRKSASGLELGNPLSTVNKQLSSLQAETAQLVTVKRGQGAMSEGDKAVADTAIGSMTGMLSNNDDVLRSTSSRMGEQFERQVKASGAEHIATGYEANPQGQVVPSARYTGEAETPKNIARAVPRAPIGGGK